MGIEVLQPPGWARPKGFSHGMVAAGRIVFVAGQVASNAEGKIEIESFAAQVGHALANILAVLAEAGGKAEHIVRLTWYITDRNDYVSQLRETGAAYRAVMGSHFPTMSVVEVTALMESAAKVEIEATAVVP
jgi:enamine deaminase RidA (YjgF/YER057c/UK114 family)